MRRLVDDHILKTPGAFLDQLQVEPNSSGLDAARTPLRLHMFDPPIWHWQFHNLRPLFDQGTSSSS